MRGSGERASGRGASCDFHRGSREKSPARICSSLSPSLSDFKSAPPPCGCGFAFHHKPDQQHQSWGKKKKRKKKEGGEKRKKGKSAKEEKGNKRGEKKRGEESNLLYPSAASSTEESETLRGVLAVFTPRRLNRQRPSPSLLRSPSCSFSLALISSRQRWKKLLAGTQPGTLLSCTGHGFFSSLMALPVQK